MGSSRFFPVLIFLLTLILGISASPVLNERATTPKCTANDIALVRRTVNDEVYFCKWWLSDGRTRSPFYQFTPIQVTNLCKCIVAGSKTPSKPKRDEISAPVENILKRQTLASCRAEVSRQFTMPWYFCTFYNAQYSAKALTTLCKCVEDVFVFKELIEVFKLVAVKDVLKDIFAKIVKVFVQDLIFIQNHVEIFLEAPENFVFVQNFFEDNLKVFVYVIDAQDFKHVEQKWNFHELVQVFVVDSHVFIIGSHVLFVVPYIFLIVVSYIFVIVNPHTLSLSPYIFFVGWLIFVISLVVHFN
ncbi:hypothetical protein D6D12_00209 [Aureobasidium pullulans]|uniref:Uncharacterized protein n=1 Tax=Aureobasidium pullulans TaxID=5580 RepID=A0AB74K643_AURPU|nr:hypothetical protein D6D12_00209 [Aureobasidium pullulans]